MINRILIRIKILQIVYAYYQNGNNDLKAAENELLFSLRKAYDLYHYLLLLIIDLTNLHERQLDSRKHKYMPTDEDLHPNMRLVNNRFAQQLSRNEDLQRYISEYKISWINDPDFLRSTLDIILSSDLYTQYIENPDDSYETDKTFWREAFKKCIQRNDYVADYLEDKSIFWNDDMETIGAFILKTIKRFREEEGSKHMLLPMFKDEEDRLFAVKLFRETLLHGVDIRQRLSHHIKNWDVERISNIDMIIMQIALTEILTFPSIPVSVSLNEYIDTAKYYGTPKSGVFINGILDAAVEELKKEKVLFKD
ncbi:MAG: transcription antitermination factor NusB [Tannerellaceae bacterium]|jgi:N utilization substance protein B|nr:transcription antitermination factor NusB [Tannerellaceae bacterium]